MPWLRIEDNFGNHPKVTAAGNGAVGLWVRCAAYSALYLTDGRIPTDVARAYGKPSEITAVLKAGLWVEHGDGYLIPDFLDYNPSRAEVLEARRRDRDRKRRQAGRQGRTEEGRFTP